MLGHRRFARASHAGNVNRRTHHQPGGCEPATLARHRAKRHEVEGAASQFPGVNRGPAIRRIELGVNQEQLAERMGTSSSTISRIERSARDQRANLERLADALEVKLLVGFETEAGDRELVVV